MSEGLANGRTVVAATNTPQKLAATSLSPKFLLVQAHESNATEVVFGGQSVGFTTRSGVAVEPGVAITLPVDDLFDVWISGTINDVVTYTYGV